MFCSENVSTEAKTDHRLYLLQEFKANNSENLNDEAG